MKLCITIDTGKYDNDTDRDVATMVHSVAYKIMRGEDEGVIRDYTGKQVGEWSYVPDETTRPTLSHLDPVHVESDSDVCPHCDRSWFHHDNQD